VKALSLDPNLAEAHAAVAVLASMMEWDWGRAEVSFQRAIRLDPSFAGGYSRYALQLRAQGRFDEAIVQLESAQRVDPISTSSDLGFAYLLTGDLERAASAWQEALELDPESYNVHRQLGNHLCRRGSFDRGLEELGRALLGVPDEEKVMADIGYCHALAGNTEKATEYLRRIEANGEHRYVDPVHPALVHLGLGETDRAIELLQRAFEIHSPLLCLAPTDPRYASIRADPRFVELVRGMGLYDLLGPPKG
jgi:Tfp pilus assembly protein PilF